VNGRPYAVDPQVDEDPRNQLGGPIAAPLQHGHTIDAVTAAVESLLWRASIGLARVAFRMSGEERLDAAQAWNAGFDSGIRAGHAQGVTA
jgi:hypothetical protein